MKPVLFLLLSLTAALTALSGPVRPAPAKVGPANFFELQVSKTLKRARLAVHHTSGDVVLAGKLRKRRIVIDFSEVQQGTYTIRLRKDGRQYEYLFTKR